MGGCGWGLLAGVVLLAGLGAPAHADTQWGPAQAVGTKTGRAVDLSRDGRVAVWIRAKGYSSGPVRTSWYNRAKSRWTPSAMLPGSIAVSSVQLSEDGKTALMESDSGLVLMAGRERRNTWNAAGAFIDGERIDHPVLAAAANMVVWVDWAGAKYGVPGTVMSRSRGADGTWADPVEVAQIDYEYENEAIPVAISGDGRTLAMVDQDHGLTVRGLMADGTWSAPTLIRQFPKAWLTPNMSLDFQGRGLIWGAWGLLAAQRAQAWALSYATTSLVDEAALSADGRTIVTLQGDPLHVVLYRRDGHGWGQPIDVGAAGVDSPVSLATSAVAWTMGPYWHDGQQRAYVSTYGRGTWRKAEQLSWNADSVALSGDGRTVMWGDRRKGRVLVRVRQARRAR